MLSKIKCLSLRQPWAWLVVNGYKDIECRTWNSNWRGEFWVHASSRLDDKGMIWLRSYHRPTYEKCCREIGVDAAKWSTMTEKESDRRDAWASADRDNFPRTPWFGAIVGKVELYNVVSPNPAYVSPWKRYPGDWCWELKNAQPLKTPQECRGQTGFFTAMMDVEAAEFVKPESRKEAEEAAESGLVEWQ